ncbi:SDR family oxidoreductase [Luteimonas sp. RD2P54]|uniref:SDR family oxidoreductase n=1 Tax=Luteimonas endophytica TaxID=3042023 RepID=A0ABT6J748_9GAMM|nr:SDR family oxidoreductase [Luteimonas endophytica]MDH5822648.1 SDR family oxidoreductase [Luteimonas endophytica]
MRILVTGATGLIGAELVERLLLAGHAVIPGARSLEAVRRRWPALEPLEIDYAAPDPDTWTRALQGVDAVVNAVGIFREQHSQHFAALHVKGPAALFAAAAAAGVGRIVQISALGADPAAATGYLASKGRADAALAALPVEAVVVRPSLVFAPAGASTRWFARLAALPLTPLPGGGRQPVQPLHLDDLAALVLRVLEMPSPPPVVDAVGPQALTLRDYLLEFKRGLGLARGFLPVPAALARLGAALAARLPGSLVTPDSLQMLEAGSVADAAPVTRLLGRPPRPPARFFDPAAQLRLGAGARLQWLVPLLRYAMAAMWIGTALVSAFVFPVAESLALLARTGLTGSAAQAALHGAAALDLLLGIALFVPRWRTWAYRAQIALVAGYTLIISVFLPEYWAHPYGPVLKNLPLLAVLVALHELDRPRWTT